MTKTWILRQAQDDKKQIQNYKKQAHDDKKLKKLKNNMKNLLNITDLSKIEIEEIINFSLKLEKNNEQTLKNKNILFAFEKPSLRTKAWTEVAINHLWWSVIHVPAENFFDGNVLFAKNEDHKMEWRESLKDTVENVSQWCDAIFARVFSHETLLAIDNFWDIPVVNALCDEHHPMQAFADLLTIKQEFKDGKITLAFVGDANNVAFSLFEILLKTGHNINFAWPKNYSFSEEKMNYLEKLAKKNWWKTLFTNNPVEAVKNVNAVYADTFISMWEEDIFDEKMKSFKNFQVNENLMSYANKNAIFMHCLPAHRNIEVTDKVMDWKNSVIYKQAKNRMVVSKWVFTKLLNPDYK